MWVLCMFPAVIYKFFYIYVCVCERERFNFENAGEERHALRKMPECYNNDKYI